MISRALVISMPFCIPSCLITSFANYSTCTNLKNLHLRHCNDVKLTCVVARIRAIAMTEADMCSGLHLSSCSDVTLT
jgi:hypothetical protein